MQLRSVCRATWVLGVIALVASFGFSPVESSSSPKAISTLGSAGAAADHEYIGSKKCRTCHLAEYNSWRKTLMAKAFDLLKPGERPEAKTAAGLDPDADYTSDAGCLSCHTTGYGTPTGFTDPKKTADLAGITCEACHGPGAGYAVDSLMSLKNKSHSFESVIAAGLVYPVPETTCRTCHNDEGPHKVSVDAKYTFDYAERVPKGTHKHPKLKYKHGPLPAGVLFQKQQ